MRFKNKIIVLICLIFSVLTQASAETSAYIIGPGDLLSISVWKEEGMQKEVQVRPDGAISFPLVGEVSAAGKTVAALRIDLETKIKAYIPSPVITVTVLKAVSNKIYVLGKVNRPGEFMAAGYMDVLQALTMAGGLTPFADSEDIKIIRRDNDNKKFIFIFSYDDVISGERLDMNIVLKPGDTVVVP